jgi:hypothetical protein
MVLATWQPVLIKKILSRVPLLSLVLTAAGPLRGVPVFVKASAASARGVLDSRHPALAGNSYSCGHLFLPATLAYVRRISIGPRM